MIPINEISLGALPGMQMQDLLDWLLQVLIMNLRAGAMLLSAPFFGSRMLPLQIRIILSFALGAFVMSQVEAPSVEVLTSFLVIPLVLQELAIGLSIGLTFTIIFAAVGLAGEKIASSSGLSFSMQVDPTGSGQTPVVSQILTLFALVIFFSINGHLHVFLLLLRSYETVPIGAPMISGVMTQAGIDAGGLMFKLAANIMLPIVAVLLIINLAIGIITKSAPQLNLFSFGFPITIFSVFILLTLSVTPFAWAFSDLVGEIVEFLEDLIGGMSNG
jgi:flagellar biosynthetic protein FliR